MLIDLKLTLYKDEVSVDSSKYRCMIGCLLYLTDYRSDIMFSVSLCARFQDNPKESHMDSILRIFRCIRSTQYLGLWYPNGSGIKVCVYADSDHAGDYVDRKSTSGVCTLVGECLTQWCCKKQTDLAISTTKDEYVTAGRDCQQALWMRQAIKDYNTHYEDVPVLCDNKGAIDLSKKPRPSLKLNISKFDITSFETMFKKGIFLWKKLRLKITSPTFLPNHSNVKRLII
ncbi:hypothetical protein Tco_0951849 [Tanacetum coccineum]|uniref:Copia protein n=1 Tax=Tanacetum coccineum TaxID=301880 RepID=A0ABQ5E234_9ASTR